MENHQILKYSPGQQAQITLCLLDNGALFDVKDLPEVKKVYFPNKAIASGFPIKMMKLEDGIYIYNFMIPNNMVGSYLFILEWAVGEVKKNQVIEVQVVTTSTNFRVSAG